MLEFICPVCKSDLDINNELCRCICQKEINIENIHGYPVTVFERQKVGKNEFSILNAAPIHDNAMKWLHDVHGTSEEDFRNKLIKNLDYSKNYSPKILVTSAGAGNDLSYLLNTFPDSKLYVQDIAFEMLEEAIKRNLPLLKASSIKFFVGDACNLPFHDNSFDIVYHFGGLNLFEEIDIGIKEMHRVAKIGGIIQFGDEGIAPWMYGHEISKILIQNNPLYKCAAPLRYLPLGVSDFKLEYLFNNCFYLIRYIKSTDPVIDLDVVHKGSRGGSLRTRYFGILEGINPDLKEKIYLLARESGKSRVEFLEGLIVSALKE
ncbi:class I SAM-dependent methyltransferase [Polynucleobacter sp. IMCC 29146]|uniref:class I SAM-dependent methyltransferase n=1 Tax=Polynucleobacter sp. IMCC 29146 TaxID=2780953 RepID=UPI001F1EFA0D|nr:class I SAM-dependent methyltransferase [Polynucleobacter sp. IMCC 29146]MCE7530642.1 class I SAM-dependent methyltransferase [Polynucleobacter sp. IMCC 29146]